MLYFIPFQYTVLNEPVARRVDAKLIVDIPQTTLLDAQKNLLVRDLVRFAYIRNCYLQNQAYLQKPESILQVHNGNMPANTHQIRVVYQYAPNSNNWYETVFYIHLDNGGTTSFLPFQQIEFTCRGEYDIYQEAFLDDLLICGVPLQAPQYEEGNIVKVCYGTTYELAEVVKDSNGQLIAVPVRGGGQSSIPINQHTNSCIHGFNLTIDVMRILGASWQKAGYDLDGGWYELILADSKQSNCIVLHIIRRDYRFLLVIDDDSSKEFYRLEEFFGFDGLQRLIKKEYGLKYMPSDIVKIQLESYINRLHSEVFLLMELPDFIATYEAGTDVELIIGGIMKEYHLLYNEAEYFYRICQIWK